MPPDVDRQTEKLPFRVIEVMNVNQINLDSSRAGIGSLLDPAGHANAAVGLCAKRVNPAATRVLVEITSTVMRGGPQAPA